MSRLALQILLLALLASTYGLVHVFAKIVVANGFGLVVIALLLALTPLLSRHLD